MRSSGFSRIESRHRTIMAAPVTAAPERDGTDQMVAVVRAAAADGVALRIEGGGTKRFYGRPAHGRVLSTRDHSGIVNYDSTELVVTARAGTPLRMLESVLAAEGQMLPFEPPHFGDSATIGGTIACGLSGPRRPWVGAVRDFVLGVRCINGRGEHLRFGGEVMKNVAGYDVARLMTGALGTLGVLTEVSLKVLPVPDTEASVGFDTDAAGAVRRMNELSGKPLPLSGACWADGRLRIRLSGTRSGVMAALQQTGGELEPNGGGVWGDLREHQLPFFRSGSPLWRFSVAPATDPVPLAGNWLIDWGGAQRWYTGPETPADIHSAAARAGGHATLFRGGDRSGEVFHPLQPGVAALHRNLKQAFDPKGIFNPGRMYADW